MRANTVVLVEGVSDQLALHALAERRGRDLGGEGIAIVPIGGTKSIGAYLDRYGPRGLDLGLAGLCDAGEEGDFVRGLERAGLGSNLTRPDLERLGFFVCDRDLEDELIRALGVDAVVRLIESEGELGRFRTFQQMPQKRGQPMEEQLRRFMGTRSGRKSQYAPLLVNALDLDRVPRPLDGVMSHLTRP